MRRTLRHLASAATAVAAILIVYLDSVAGNTDPRVSTSDRHTLNIRIVVHMSTGLDGAGTRIFATLRSLRLPENR